MTTGKKKRRAPRKGSKAQLPKTYRLAAGKVAEARRILGASSDTAAIEMALDLVTFPAELTSGIRAMRGTRLARFDGRTASTS